jgi:hypothetical protein
MSVPNGGSDNVEKLVRAGLLTPDERGQLGDDMTTRINDLTEDEISALLSVKARLGYKGTLATRGDGPSISIF